MMPLIFRAWDNNNKKWLLGYDLPNLGGFSMHGECMLSGEYQGVLNDFFNRMDDLIITQWTGLVDKNTKKIYGGDVVKFYHNGCFVFCIIIFINGMFCLEWKDGYINKYPCSPEKYEIVTNIFENPQWKSLA